MRWCSIRCSKSNCAARPSRTHVWPRQARRASPSRCRTSRPAADEDHGPRRYLSLLERAAAAVSVPVIGSLNGSTPGSWARIRPVDAGFRCGRNRIEHLLPARRSAHLRPRRRTASPRHPGAGQGRGDRTGGREAQPVLQRDRRDGAAPGPGRRGRAGAVQPIPAARHRPRDPGRGAGDVVVHARPRLGCR